MASQIKHFINNTEVQPYEGKNIGIKMNFIGAGTTVNELNTDSVKFATEAKKLILDHIAVNGVFQGIPYRVEVDSVVIDMFIDLVNSPKISGDGDSFVEVKVKRRKSWAEFKANADDLTFESVNLTHPISTIKIPYVIIPDNQGAAFITAAIGTFVLGKALIESVLELGKGIAEFAEAVSPTDTVLVAGLTGPSFGVVLVKIGSIIMAALKLVLRILYFIGMMLLFINMLNKMLSIISPLVHNLKGSTVLELINKGCAKLGYTFQSSILTTDLKNALTIVPVPLVDASPSIWQQSFFSSFTNSYNKGYPTASDTIKTLGSLIDAMITMFNGKVHVINGVVILERRDFLLNISADTIKTTLNIQAKRENQWGFNTADAWKRYWIHMQVDHSDTHTVDNMTGVHAEYSTEPTNVVAVDLVNIKGLSDVSIPFAFAIRKEKVTLLEKSFKALAIAVNAAGSIFGGNDSVDPFKSSLGVMKISSQHFSTTKIMYNAGGGKQSSTFLNKIGTTALWSSYHHINEVSKNFKEIYRDSVRFSSQNLVNLQGNNYAYDENGELLEILDFDWTNESKTAQIEYQIDSNVPTHTKTIKIR